MANAALSDYLHTGNNPFIHPYIYTYIHTYSFLLIVHVHGYLRAAYYVVGYQFLVRCRTGQKLYIPMVQFSKEYMEPIFIYRDQQKVSNALSCISKKIPFSFFFFFFFFFFSFSLSFSSYSSTITGR